MVYRSVILTRVKNVINPHDLKKSRSRMVKQYLISSQKVHPFSEQINLKIFVVYLLESLEEI